ncbi:MAG: hypothetical protein GY849_01170, partial [Deltaproteobacteria bacterium]|nr:hypothetical protein [Deltaproteobacteria bacterium]
KKYTTSAVRFHHAEISIKGHYHKVFVVWTTTGNYALSGGRLDMQLYVSKRKSGRRYKKPNSTHVQANQLMMPVLIDDGDLPYYTTHIWFKVAFTNSKGTAFAPTWWYAGKIHTGKR